jgi:hypothetical protein
VRFVAGAKPAIIGRSSLLPDPRPPPGLLSRSDDPSPPASGCLTVLTAPARPPLRQSPLPPLQTLHLLWSRRSALSWRLPSPPGSSQFGSWPTLYGTCKPRSPRAWSSRLLAAAFHAASLPPTPQLAPAARGPVAEATPHLAARHAPALRSRQPTPPSGTPWVRTLRPATAGVALRRPPPTVAGAATAGRRLRRLVGTPSSASSSIKQRIQHQAADRPMRAEPCGQSASPPAAPPEWRLAGGSPRPAAGPQLSRLAASRDLRARRGARGPYLDRHACSRRLLTTYWVAGGVWPHEAAPSSGSADAAAEATYSCSLAWSPGRMAEQLRGARGFHSVLFGVLVPPGRQWDGLLGPAPRAGPSSRARRAAAGGHAPGSRPAPPRSAPRACAPWPGSSSCCLHLRAAPRRGRGTGPRLAARASPLRVPGLLARAGFFELASRGPHAADPDPLLLFSAAGPMLVTARLVT